VDGAIANKDTTALLFKNSLRLIIFFIG